MNQDPAATEAWHWLDIEILPRLVFLGVVLGLAFTSLRQAGGVAQIAMEVAALAASGVWFFNRERLTHLGWPLGTALVVLGLYASRTWQDDLLLVVGLATLALALPRTWLLGVLASGGAVSWLNRVADGSPGWQVLPDIAAMVLVILVLTVLEFLYVATVRLRTTRELLTGEHLDQERTRLAAEIQRLLGATLTDASEQVRRARALLGGSPARTDKISGHLDELGKQLASGTDHLARVAFESTVLPLEEELQIVATLCSHLDVELTLDTESMPNDLAIAELAALVIRESITNMFRHARPSRCVLVLRNDGHQVLIGITNDGATPGSGGLGGTGHRRWRAMLEAMGGNMETSRLAGGRYRVHVTVPISGDRAVDPR